MNEFENILKEYRERDFHFLHLNTAKRDLFFILDDSYYLTYRDDKKEIALSLLLKPKDETHDKIYFYNTNNRSFDEWYADVCEEYDKMDDAKFYHAPDYEDIYINYVNEEEKVPLKNFLAVLPKTNYKIIGDYIIFEEIGAGLSKKNKPYKVSEETTMSAQIHYWLHFNEEEMKPFNYIIEEPVKSVAIRIDAIEEIVPSHTNVRFVFDNGSVQILKKILENQN